MVLSPLLLELLLIPIVFYIFAFTELLLLSIVISFIGVATVMYKIATINRLLNHHAIDGIQRKVVPKSITKNT
jgi:hypothetical protein